VDSEEDRREVSGKELPKEVGEWMVVVRRERIRGGYRVEVGVVEFAEVIGRSGMEDKAVDVVLEELPKH